MRPRAGERRVWLCAIYTRLNARGVIGKPEYEHGHYSPASASFASPPKHSHRHSLTRTGYSECVIARRGTALRGASPHHTLRTRAGGYILDYVLSPPERCHPILLSHRVLRQSVSCTPEQCRPRTIQEEVRRICSRLCYVAQAGCCYHACSPWLMQHSGGMMKRATYVSTRTLHSAESN